MDRKLINIISKIILILIIGCKGKEENNTITIYKSLGELVDLRNYKIKSKKENDSVIVINGENKKILISGKTLNNKKYGRWHIYEKNKNNYILVDFLIIDNKEFINQYRTFENGKISKLASKFYEVKKKNDILQYVFNMPTNPSDTIVIHSFLYGSSPNQKDSIFPERSGNTYIGKIKIHSNTQIIKGLFTEGIKKKYDLGLNSIYTSDSIH